MKKFVFRLLLIAIPLAIFFISMEYYCRTQTNFGIKKKYLDSNSDQIELLILGSSHNQNAINPEFLNGKACNLAFGGQPISIDYYLLEKYIDKMPKLSTVVLEFSPHRFYNDLVPSEWNGHIYSVLYNIKHKTEPISLKNYSLVFSDYTFFSSIFYDYCNPYAFKYKTNQYGFVTNDFNDRFEKLKYDTALINKTYTMQHSFYSRANFILNKEFYIKAIRKCQEKGVKVIFITPPFYKTYTEKIPINAKHEVDSLAADFVAKYGVKYFDYSSDNRINIYDFKNDNHLNSTGAEKFTKLINTEIFGNK